MNVSYFMAVIFEYFLPMRLEKRPVGTEKNLPLNSFIKEIKLPNLSQLIYQINLLPR